MPGHVLARASYRPAACAQAANLVPLPAAAVPAGLDGVVLDSLLTRSLYRDLATYGLTANLYRHTATAAGVRRFRAYEDMIPRFVCQPRPRHLLPLAVAVVL
ncbi:MAG: hypothetical protein ACLPUO_14845 [Streptosporangiaceae bacterium]